MCNSPFDFCLFEKGWVWTQGNELCRHNPKGGMVLRRMRFFYPTHTSPARKRTCVLRREGTRTLFIGTSSSPVSRNRTFGKQLSQQSPREPAEQRNLTSISTMAGS